MKKFIKALIIVLVVIIVIFLAAYLYFINMPDKDVSKLKPDYQVTASALAQEYESEPEMSDKKYIDKIIEVTGTITEISKDQNDSFVFILKQEDSNTGVLCTLSQENDKKASSYKVGDKVTIRGTCSGMLFEVVLNKCAIVK
jgi:uncharacterized protein YpmB